MFTDLFEQLGAGIAGDIVSNGKGTVGARAFGMDAPLRNVLAVEMGELLDQVEVVEQQRTARAGGAGVLVVGYRCTAGGGENLAHGLSLSVFERRLIGLRRSIDER
ncbi:hypothetical protein D9M71_525640 [compost metagenome]